MQPIGNPILDASQRLDENGVAYVIVGGAAAILHGSAYVTQDVDFSCKWSRDNLTRLAEALKGLNPRFRAEGVVEGADIPGGITAAHLLSGVSFSFITDVGNLDFRKSVDGIGPIREAQAINEDADEP